MVEPRRVSTMREIYSVFELYHRHYEDKMHRRFRITIVCVSMIVVAFVIVWR